MIQYLNGNDDVLWDFPTPPTPAQLANRGTDGFFPEEKKYVDTETSVETLNPNFDQAISDEGKLRNMNLRHIRDTAIAMADEWMLEDANSAANVAYTTAEKDTIKTFRQELRDWPSTLKTNGFTALAVPTVPSFASIKSKDRIDKILGEAQL